MKSKSWRWLLVSGLAIALCANASAGDRGDHHKHRLRGGDNKSHGYNKQDDFAQRIYRATKADSIQKVKMKPSIDRASKKLDALRLSYQKREKQVLDSLNTEVKPFLKEDQLKALKERKDKRKGR